MSIEKVSYDYAYNELKYNNDILESIIEMHVDENNINQSGGAKKCSIEKSDKIFFGNGGSSSIIVITRSKKVFKMMTHYFWSDMIEDEINNRNKIEKIRTNNEIKILELLTKHIVNKNVSPHFVKLVDTNVCTNSKNLFKECKSYVAFLKNKNKSQKCIQYFGGFPIKKLEDKYTVIELEYCPGTCSTLLQNLANEKIQNIKIALDKLFFQICYTLVATQKKYPFFVHYDLFIRNVMGTFESFSGTNKGKYYRYTINGLTYDIPVGGFFAKINDFGLTNLNVDYHDRKLEKSDIQDFYNFVLDVYDGGNLGGDSLFKLFSQIKNKKERDQKIYFLDNYFNNFFNVKKLLELFKFGKQNIDWDWGAIQDEQIKNYIKIKTPKELLVGYFYELYHSNNSHKIKENYVA